MGSINLGEIITVGTEDADGFLVGLFPGGATVFTFIYFTSGNAAVLKTIVTVEVIPQGRRLYFISGHHFFYHLAIIPTGKTILAKESIYEICF